MSFETNLALMDARVKHRALCDELQKLYLQVYASAPGQYKALQEILDAEDVATLADYRIANERLMKQMIDVMRLLPPDPLATIIPRSFIP